MSDICVIVNGIDNNSSVDDNNIYLVIKAFRTPNNNH